MTHPDSTAAIAASPLSLWERGAGGVRSYPAYLDSGVPWLGSIPAHWQVKRLKFVTQMKYGESLAADDREVGDIPVFGSNGVIGNHSQSNTLGPCLLIGRKGSYGKVTYSHEPGFVIDTAYSIDATQTASDLRWLYYALLCIGLDQVSQDTGVPGLSREVAYNLWLAFPPLAEQCAIAAYLDRETARLDALVAAKERLIALLREKRAALISRAVTRGLDPAAPMKDSGVPWLGAIPAHWEVKRCKSLFHEMDDRTETGQEMLLSLRMNEGLIPHSQVSDTPVTNEQLIGYKRTKPGDVVMNRMRAASGLFAATKTLGIVSPDYAILRPATNISPDYFAYLFKISVMQSVFRIYSKGLGTGEAGFLRLYTEQFGTISVPVPPPGEQRIIADYLDQETAKLDALVATIRRHIEKVKEYRAALIAAAVTGKIDVREREAANE